LIQINECIEPADEEPCADHRRDEGLAAPEVLEDPEDPEDPEEFGGFQDLPD